MKRLAGPIGRRSLIAGLGLTVAGGARGALPDSSVATEGTLIVAGPPGGRLDRWADVLAAKIGRALPARTPLARQNVGGLDGVTGANQFEVRGEPDGSTALLVPGAAALSWLIGETRAKFDPAHWLPLWAGAGSAVLVSRVALTPGRALRVAGEGPAGVELPALLALDLLGIDGQPVGAASPDAVLIRGQDMKAALLTAAVSGMVPVMTFGAVGLDGKLGRDPAYPAVPTAFELVGVRAPAPMLAALRASTLAVQLDAGLVLPQLTPAATVALWRNACAPLLADADVTAEAARMGARLIPASMAADCTSRIAGDPAMLLALRRWLATRYDWRPA